MINRLTQIRCILTLLQAFAWSIVMQGASGISGAAGVDTVVVCRQAWRAELAAWLALRETQGREVLVIEPSLDPQALRQSLQEWHAQGALRYVVLIGDTNLSGGVPTSVFPTTAAVNWGAPAEFSSDFLFSELNDDGIPDVAVGRISVERRDQLRQVLARIVQYETSPNVGFWQQRVEIVGGMGGFGPFVDNAVESAVQSLLVNGIPTAYRTSLIYANWKSPYCPALQHFQETMLARYNSGCLLWVYAGHGHVHRLDQVAAAPLLQTHEVHRLRSATCAPIAALLSCNSGKFDAQQECLAEAMVRSPGGPIAVLASTSISMPYGSIALADAMLRSTFAGTAQTLGDSFLAAQRELVEPNAPRRKWIDQIAGLFGVSAETRKRERLDHVRMFHLLGDPLLRIPFPAEATLTAPSTATAGDTIKIQLESPVAGNGRLELACQRGQLRFAARTRSDQELHDESQQRAWDQECQDANSDTWCHVHQAFTKGSSELQIAIPDSARGSCHLRVFIANASDSAIGSAPVYVRVPERDAHQP